MPDTSARGIEWPQDDTKFDLPDSVAGWCAGLGAGHYCNATGEDWKKHFNMYTYVTKELPDIVNRYFPVDPAAKSVSGNSMGGNGALVVGLRNSKEWQSVSAFAPGSAFAKPGFTIDALRLMMGDGADWEE